PQSSPTLAVSVWGVSAPGSNNQSAGDAFQLISTALVVSVLTPSLRAFANAAVSPSSLISITALPAPPASLHCATGGSVAVTWPTSSFSSPAPCVHVPPESGSTVIAISLFGSGAVVVFIEATLRARATTVVPDAPSVPGSPSGPSGPS